MFKWVVGAILIFGCLYTSDALHPLELKKDPLSNCTKCELIVDLLEVVLHLDGVPVLGIIIDDCVELAVMAICEGVAHEDDFVCNGILGEFWNETMYIIKTYLSENPDNLCGVFPSLNCDSDTNPFDVRWRIKLPGIKPPHKEVQIPTNPPKTLKVLHLSDLHIDPEYVEGSNATCGEPQCCRSYIDNIEFVRPKVASTENPNERNAQKWGTIGDCDIPYWTVENMLQHITKTHKDIDYVVVSGDLESHAVWTYTVEAHEQRIQNISALLRQYFQDTPVYFALGNHEGVPIDSLAPHWAPSQFSYQPIYDVMANAWKGWVPDDQNNTMHYRGSYMKILYPGLRLISLNTLYGDPMNFWLVMNQTDPDGTMSWLIDQLAIAEYYGDKVQIVAHIPGSTSEAYEGWALNFYHVVNRFEDTIVGQFMGHTHSEQYYMYYEDPEDHTSRPTSVVYSAPSVTTYSDYNPAYRIYTIDGNYSTSTYQIIDFEEYFLNLTKHGNDETLDDSAWESLYTQNSVKKEYGLADLSPASWNDLANRLITDSALMQTYLKNYYRRTDNDREYIKGCDKNCTNKFVCNIRKAHHSDNLCKGLPIDPKDYAQPVLYRKPVFKEFRDFEIETKEDILELVQKTYHKYPMRRGKAACGCSLQTNHCSTQSP